MEKVQFLNLVFKNKLFPWECEYFRGAINKVLDNEKILFHNHIDNKSDKFRYSYPLIQYKRINGQAAIMCFGEGTKEIGALFMKGEWKLKIKDREELYEIDRIIPGNMILQVWNNQFRYVVRRWMALNQENYRKYSNMDGIIEKTAFLENILRGNILSLCKGLGIYLDKELKCTLIDISKPTTYRYKGIPLQTFDALFTTNIAIPNYAGIGKGVSIGYGICHDASKLSELTPHKRSKHL